MLKLIHTLVMQNKAISLWHHNTASKTKKNKWNFKNVKKKKRKEGFHSQLISLLSYVMHETGGCGAGERGEGTGTGTAWLRNTEGGRAHSQRAGGALSTGILNWKRERRKIIVPYRLHTVVFTHKKKKRKKKRSKMLVVHLLKHLKAVAGGVCGKA